MIAYLKGNLVTKSEEYIILEVQGIGYKVYMSKISIDKLGEENYNAIKNAKDELVEYSKQAIEIIGNFSSKTWSNVKNKVKNWYEEFRNN